MEVYDKQNILCTLLHLFVNNITSYQFYKLLIIKHKNKNKIITSNYVWLYFGLNKNYFEAPNVCHFKCFKPF